MSARGIASRPSGRSSPTRWRRPTRSPTRRWPATTRSCSTSWATYSFSRTSWRCCSPSEATVTWRRCARHVTAKLVARHPHVFGDVEAQTAERVRENWERLKVEQEAARACSTTFPRRCPRSCSRARCSAVPPRPGSTTPTREERSGISTEELARAPGRAASGQVGEGEPAATPGLGARRRAVRVRERRAAAERRSRARARAAAERFRARVVEAERLAAEAGETWRSLDLAAQDTYFDRAKSFE